MTDTNLGTAAGDIFAKAFTLGYETGRKYVPVGGMALTAEQMEDVRALVWLDGRRNFDAFRRLRALFPATEPASSAADFIDIVFDGPPAAESGRFVEVENPSGAGINVGEWIERDGGHWALRIRSDEPHLESPDRMIPEAGHILTTEEMADVRTLYMKGSTVDPEFHRAKERLRPTLFPAAEPALYCSKGVCSANEGHDGTCAEASGWAHDAYEDDPAPAVPAEEEAKAEDYCCHPKCRFTDWGGINRKHERGADCPIVPKPASSPVVPAPTETGPWQTLAEVPQGVKSVRDRTGQCWRYYPFIGWSCDFPGHRSQPMNDFAPFVAA